MFQTNDVITTPIKIMNVKKIEKSIKKKGFCVIENFFSKKKCDYYIKLLKNILVKRIKKNYFVGHRNAIVLFNYFLEHKKLYELIYNVKIDKVLKKLIDEDYVLTTATARNQFKSNIESIKLFEKTSGQKWHTDNRYLNGRALKPSLSYLVIFALEDLTEKNGSTLFLKNSHKLNYKSKITRNSKIETLTAKKGSLIFMDTNLLHKAGNSTTTSRWSIFNIYSPWFVKPYFQFHKLINKNKVSKKIKKLLHFNSIPPINYTDRRNTLQKKI